MVLGRGTGGEQLMTWLRNADEYHSCAASKGVTVERREKRWERPFGDQMKINTDGAFHQISGDGGWGCVIGDATGDVLRAGAGM